MEKKGNKKKRQVYGRFYSSLLLLPYRFSKGRLVEIKIRFHHFRKVIIAIKIVRFPREENFPGLLCSKLNLKIRKKHPIYNSKSKLSLPLIYHFQWRKYVYDVRLHCFSWRQMKWIACKFYTFLETALFLFL